MPIGVIWEILWKFFSEVCGPLKWGNF